MKAYSDDIRRRIVRSYQNGEGSQRQLAARFSVSLSFVRDLLRRFHSTGRFEPQPHGGGRTAMMNEETLAVVADLLRANPRATLDELCAQLAGRGHERPSRATMHRALRKMKVRRGRSRRAATTTRARASAAGSGGRN